MLERARRRLEDAGVQATLVRQRLERLQLDGRFRTSIIGLDSFGLLVKRSAQLAALRGARAHATHDGRLVLDLANGDQQCDRVRDHVPA